MKTIKTASIIGLLRSRGFTKRLANMPLATPIRDDETGRYNMLSLTVSLLIRLQGSMTLIDRSYRKPLRNWVYIASRHATVRLGRLSGESPATFRWAKVGSH